MRNFTECNRIFENDANEHIFLDRENLKVSEKSDDGSEMYVLRSGRQTKRKNYSEYSLKEKLTPTDVDRPSESKSSSKSSIAPRALFRQNARGAQASTTTLKRTRADELFFKAFEDSGKKKEEELKLQEFKDSLDDYDDEDLVPNSQTSELDDSFGDGALQSKGIKRSPGKLSTDKGPGKCF